MVDGVQTQQTLSEKAKRILAAHDRLVGQYTPQDSKPEPKSAG